MFTISLAVSTKHSAAGEDASIALRAVPTEIIDGQVVTRDADAQTYYRGSVAEITDEAEAVKVAALVAAIKALVQE